MPAFPQLGSSTSGRPHNKQPLLQASFALPQPSLSRNQIFFLCPPLLSFFAPSAPVLCQYAFFSSPCCCSRSFFKFPPSCHAYVFWVYGFKTVSTNRNSSSFAENAEGVNPPHSVYRICNLCYDYFKKCGAFLGKKIFRLPQLRSFGQKKKAPQMREIKKKTEKKLAAVGFEPEISDLLSTTLPTTLSRLHW